MFLIFVDSDDSIMLEKNLLVTMSNAAIDSLNSSRNAI